MTSPGAAAAQRLQVDKTAAIKIQSLARSGKDRHRIQSLRTEKEAALTAEAETAAGKLQQNSEQNAIKEYTKPPAVKTVVINNNRTNNVTKTVNQGSSLPQFDRKESANPLAQGGNKRTAMGAF
jgi:hypothetical protein